MSTTKFDVRKAVEEKKKNNSENKKNNSENKKNNSENKAFDVRKAVEEKKKSQDKVTVNIFDNSIGTPPSTGSTSKPNVTTDVPFKPQIPVWNPTPQELFENAVNNSKKSADATIPTTKFDVRKAVLTSPYIEATKNAYTTAKTSKDETTTFESELSEEDRKKRIKEIKNELDTLSRARIGLDRGALYGDVSKMIEQNEAKQAELHEELKKLERTGTFTNSEMLNWEINDASAEVRRLRDELNSYGSRPSTTEIEEYRAKASERYAAQQKLDDLVEKQKMYKDITEFGDDVKKDDFFGQTAANYRLAELSRDADKAMSDYIDNPTEENLQRAYVYDALVREYQANNKLALDENGQVLPWISKSAAGYMPQFFDQIVPQVVGGVVGGVLGSAVGATGAGAGIGAGLATGIQSYDVMRGSVYRSLLAEGIDEETAMSAANDEALISALIEGGGTALSFALSGGGMALSAIGKAAQTSVAKGSTNAATKFIANLAGKGVNRAAAKASASMGKTAVRTGIGIALESGSEYLEEATQEGVSIANQERAKKGETGKVNLVTNAGEKIWDAVTGKDKEALLQMHEAGKEGAKIGLMLGGTNTVMNNVITHYANAKTVKQQNEILDRIINDEKALNDVIEEGKANGKVSEKIAKEIEASKKKGKVTREQVKRLLASNGVYIENDEKINGNAQDSTAEATANDSAIGDTIPTPESKTTKTTPKPMRAALLEMQMEAMSRENEPVTVDEIKTATAMGDSGAVLVSEIMKNKGVSYSVAKKAVETAYRAGFTDLDESQVNLTTDTQKLAFRAGKDDRQTQNILAMKNAQKATVYDGEVEESEYFKKLPPQAQEMAKSFSKDFGMSSRFVDSLIASIVDGERHYANAQHEDGVLSRADNSENPVHEDLVHEALHRMMQVAPEETGLLLNVLYESAEQNGRALSLGVTGISRFDAVRTDYSEAGVSLNTLEVLEEVGAQEIQYLFNSPEAFNEWRAKLETDANLKKGWAKVVEFITELIEKVKQFVKQIGMTAEEKAKAQKEIEILERYANAYKATMNAVAEKSLQKGEEVKANEGYNVKTSNSISKKTKFRPAHDWHTGLTKDQVIKVQEWVNKAGTPESKQITDTSYWYTGRLGGDDLFVIYSTEDSTSTVLYLKKGKRATTELNILKDLLEEKENGESAYGKSSFTQRVSQRNWVQNVNGSQHNIQRLGTAANNRNAGVLPQQSRCRGSRAFENVIKNLFEVQESNASKRGVKTSHSLKAKDAQYLELAKNPDQNEAKLREMVDEAAVKAGARTLKNGAPMHYYHGTKASFTSFEAEKARSGNHGYGFYFSPMKDKASDYGNLKDVYLLTSKIATHEDHNITADQVVSFLNAYNIALEDSIFRYTDSVEEWVSKRNDVSIVHDLQFFYDAKVKDADTDKLLKNMRTLLGYDGMRHANETVLWDNKLIKLADLVTYDDNGNVIPLSERFNNKNKDTRFSLKKSVEETKDLVAVHNMRVAELEKSIALGGLPMPSIAIIKAQSGHSEYGDVSLVFPKSTIDPKASKYNKVYGGDAWTPTYPKIEFKANAKVEQNISDTYYRLSKQYGNDEARPLYNYAQDLEDMLNREGGEAPMIEKLLSDTRLMQLYLLDSGKGKVEDVVKETKTTLSKEETDMYDYLASSIGKDVIGEIVAPKNVFPSEHRREYWRKHGEAIKEAYGKMLSEMYKFNEKEIENVELGMKTFDYLKIIASVNRYLKNGAETVKTERDNEATEQAIRNAVDKTEYTEWINGLFKGAEEKSGIRNNVDYFTNSGNRRSWEALHWENNLENVVKVMRAGDNGQAFFGGMGIWGVSTKNYSSVEELKADSSRLEKMSQEEYEKIKEGFGQRFQEIAISIMDKSEKNEFIAIDNAMECIVDAIRVSKTKSGILNELKQYKHLNVTQTTVEDIVSLVSDIANMPTEYFEAKPQRAVGFDEIATAIIPDNASEELKAKLTEINVPYVEYESGNEESRAEALNSLEDVKFSLKGRKSLSSKDTKELLDVIEHLQNEFKRTEFAKADPKKLADMTKKLLREYSSKASYETVLENIDDLYTYIANGEDEHPAVWEDVYNGAMSIANDIVKAAVAVDDSAYREYEALRKYLRTVPIKFNSAYDSVPSSYENFRDFRRKNYGRFNFTKDGMSIDSMYQELSDMYPEFFNSEEETNSADMLERIVDVLDEIQPTTINPFSHEMTEVSTYLANDIISRFFEIPQAKPTFADKAERRVIKAEIAGAKKVDQVRQQRDAKIQKLLANHRAKTKQLIENAKKAKSEAVSKEKAKREKAVSKMKESQKAKVLRARIMRHASELGKKLLHPSDNQHIPQNLQGAVAALLEHINLESNYTYDATSDSYKKNDEGLPTSRTAAFEVLRRVYSQIAESAVIDPDLMGDDGLLSDVIALGDKRIADMTSEELNTVWQTMRAIEATISTANKLFSASKFEAISEITNALRVDNDGKKVRKELRIGNKLQTLAQLNMLTPETYFHYLGDAGDTIFRMMRDAQDKHISIMKEVTDFTHEVLKGVNINKLEKTLHTVTLGGEKVTLTTAQLMELYVLMKRKQAVEHILLGGILPDNIDKGVLKKNKVEPTRNIKQEEIGKALSELTDEEKAIADKLQNFVSTVLSRHGNEASMQVYNYEKFLEENYWTIRTNKQEIASDVGKDTAVITVANKGMAKGTIPHANTSVRIGSIFDTFSAHSSDMATYAAWLGTTEDINRIRNFVFWEDGARTGTVKGIIDTVHGTHGTEYLHKLLTDISVGVRGTDNMNPFDKFVGNYKAASVGANIRVIIQQPTAILRALDMIAPQYIALSGVKPLEGWANAKKYAPIAQWKDWGHFDINTGRQMKDVLFDNAGVLEKVKQAGMWGASKADSFSWGALWNAVEAETKAKHKDLKVGSKEYYNTVSKRFTEIVDHTQVVDGILQRSGLMRSPDSLTKMATSFMGEPTKQYNMAATAIYDVVTKKGEDKRKAAGRLGRTAISLAVAGIVNACVQSIVDALRDDDKEKKYWEKWLASFGDNSIDTVNPLNYVPFAKDIVSIMQGYDVKRMDTETITKTFNAVENMYKAVTGTGKYTIANASANLFAEVARLFGVPVANVKRDVLSVITTVAIQTDNYLMQYRIEKAMLDINYAYNSKNFMDILFNAYSNDREAYELIYKDLLKSGYDAETIQGNMETRMKKAEGVKTASELSKRYMTPADEKKYDNSLAKIQASGVWKSANAEQRKDAEADIYQFLTSTSKDMEKLRTEARAFGVDETEYTLWQLAIEMSDNGNNSYDAKEKAKAVEMLNLGDAEITYFYNTKQADEAYAHGLDMMNYALFKAAVSGLKGDDKEQKVKAYAKQYADTEKERLFFMGTVYDSWKKRNDYIKYFGK